MADLRCPNKKHAELVDGVVEIKCRQMFCKGDPGIVVIHRWDAITGESLEDKRFRDPESVIGREGNTSGAQHDSPAVRTASDSAYPVH